MSYAEIRNRSIHYEIKIHLDRNTLSIHDFIQAINPVGYFKTLDLVVRKYINCMILTKIQTAFSFNLRSKHIINPAVKFLWLCAVPRFVLSDGSGRRRRRRHRCSSLSCQGRHPTENNNSAGNLLVITFT
jgi:hypothetical protein